MNNYIISLIKKNSIKPEILKTEFLLSKGTIFIYDELVYEVTELKEIEGKKIIICDEL